MIYETSRPTATIWTEFSNRQRKTERRSLLLRMGLVVQLFDGHLRYAMLDAGWPASYILSFL